VCSGSKGHLHGYWPLRHPLAPAWAKRANLRLALALGADRNATDPARILRPIGSRNYKTDPPAPVVCVRLELDVFTFEQVVGHLADEREWTAPGRIRPPESTGSPDGLLAGLVRVVREARSPRGDQPGERNDKLNWAAYRAREHVAAGKLNPETVERELLAAAIAIGLPEGEAQRTIRSGLTARATA
jgi:hypothetical protein